jgi:hypothetical protein
MGQNRTSPSRSSKKFAHPAFFSEVRGIDLWATHGETTVEQDVVEGILLEHYVFRNERLLLVIWMYPHGLYFAIRCGDKLPISIVLSSEDVPESICVAYEPTFDVNGFVYLYRW